MLLFLGKKERVYEGVQAWKNSKVQLRIEKYLTANRNSLIIIIVKSLIFKYIYIYIFTSSSYPAINFSIISLRLTCESNFFQEWKRVKGINSRGINLIGGGERRDQLRDSFLWLHSFNLGKRVNPMWNPFFQIDAMQIPERTEDDSRPLHGEGEREGRGGERERDTTRRYSFFLLFLSPSPTLVK